MCRYMGCTNGLKARQNKNSVTPSIGRDVPDASGHDAYVAGPVALGDALEALLTAKGLPERRFFCERFYAVAS